MTGIKLPSEILNDGDKKWIDEAPYAIMLKRWRTAPLGDDIFCGVTGKYYAEVMQQKREAITDNQYVEISKNIGVGEYV